MNNFSKANNVEEIAEQTESMTRFHGAKSHNIRNKDRKRERSDRQVYVVTCLSTVVVMAPSFINRPRGCSKSDSTPTDSAQCKLYE